MQKRDRLSVRGVAGNPTLTEATPRLSSSRDVALLINVQSRSINMLATSGILMYLHCLGRHVKHDGNHG